MEAKYSANLKAL